jgi:fructose-bisphosphate aldolase class I
MFDETLRDTTVDGRKVIDVIKEKGMIAGIKVDKGVKVIMQTIGETAT